MIKDIRVREITFLQDVEQKDGSYVCVEKNISWKIEINRGVGWEEIKVVKDIVQMKPLRLADQVESKHERS